jgi:hypothetical protein
MGSTMEELELIQQGEEVICKAECSGTSIETIRFPPTFIFRPTWSILFIPLRCLSAHRLSPFESELAARCIIQYS